MSRSSYSPRTQRGALVKVDLLSPTANVVVFQYNPDSVSRTLEPQQADEEGERSEVQRLRGAPVENISLEVEIDSADQFEQNGGVARELGVYPQLSALEMLVYPSSEQVITNTTLLLAGTMEVTPPSSPLTLFVWGPKRVLPVRVTSLSITEQAYDQNLNPVRARIKLALRVLTYSDLPVTHPGYGLFLAHQIVKEAMAIAGTVRGISGGVTG